jgi:hypothetical protein
MLQSIEFVPVSCLKCNLVSFIHSVQYNTVGNVKGKIIPVLN